MESLFKTPDKTYTLSVEKFICNRFGLSEFLSLHTEIIDISAGARILDVGCGACPISIFLADNFKCSVVGIELSYLAYSCGLKNIARYNLAEKIRIYNQDFQCYSDSYRGSPFDVIVINPPVDENVPEYLIKKYDGYDYSEFTDESFSYLTNSWHSADGKDLLDFVFEFGFKNLKASGSIYVVFCAIDCHASYVINKAARYGFIVDNHADGYIEPESIGFASSELKKIPAFLIKFIKGCK